MRMNVSETNFNKIVQVPGHRIIAFSPEDIPENFDESLLEKEHKSEYFLCFVKLDKKNTQPVYLAFQDKFGKFKSIDEVLEKSTLSVEIARREHLIKTKNVLIEELNSDIERNRKVLADFPNVKSVISHLDFTFAVYEDIEKKLTQLLEELSSVFFKPLNKRQVEQYVEAIEEFSAELGPSVKQMKNFREKLEGCKKYWETLKP